MEEIIKLIIAISLLALTFYVLKKDFVKDDLVYKIMGLIMELGKRLRTLRIGIQDEKIFVVICLRFSRVLQCRQSCTLVYE